MPIRTDLSKFLVNIISNNIKKISMIVLLTLEL